MRRTEALTAPELASYFLARFFGPPIWPDAHFAASSGITIHLHKSTQ
jgi:hypothetical protein